MNIHLLPRIAPLQIVSYLAPNWFGFYQAVSAYLSRVLAREVQLVQGQCNPLADPMLLQDQIDLAFICGLPFSRYYQTAPSQFQAVVALVMQAPRYQDRPIYFSDVIVNASSGFTTFESLAGTNFCYNDPNSHSGYNLVCQRLLQTQQPQNFFGKVIQSGSHQTSIRWVVEGKADWAGIDSTVWEKELQDFPELANLVRVVEAIGPSPMPPIIAASHLGQDLIRQIQTALLHPDPELQAAMPPMAVKRFSCVSSENYHLLAQSYNAALNAGYIKLR